MSRPGPKLVRPRCCTRGAACIWLSYGDLVYGARTREEFVDFVHTTPPGWYMEIMPRASTSVEQPPIVDGHIAWCPFCGEKLPTPVRNLHQKRMAVVTDGGYYCDACTKRLQTCRCPTPEQHWKAP